MKYSQKHFPLFKLNNMAKNKTQQEEYQKIGKARMQHRKAKRIENWIKNARYKVGSGMYERLVEQGLIQTCDWGSSRCDLHGCNGDC